MYIGKPFMLELINPRINQLEFIDPSKRSHVLDITAEMKVADTCRNI